jgi:hypothetical protein
MAVGRHMRRLAVVGLHMRRQAVGRLAHEKAGSG